MADSDKKNTKKIIEKFKNLQAIIFKSEGLRISALVFFVIILLVFALPFSFNNAALKYQIIQKVNQISGANFVINGDVTISFLPYPSITVGDALLQNYKSESTKKTYNFYAKSVQIIFPVFNFSDDVFVKKIIFTDAILESYIGVENFSSHENQLTKIIAEFTKNSPAQESKVASGISAKLFSIGEIKSSASVVDAVKEIVVENGEMIIYDRLTQKKEIKSINVDAKISEKRISAQGNFNSENIVSNFKFLAQFNSQSTKPESLLEVTSPVMSMSVTGNFTSENRGIVGSDFKGKIEAEIFELKSFYKSYVSNSDIISAKLKYSSKPIKISADIANKSQEIAIKNLLISSILANGSGEIDLDLAGKIPLIDLDLNLENFDLDGIWSDEAAAINAAITNQNNSQNNVVEIAEISANEASRNDVADKPEESSEHTNSDSIAIEKNPKQISPIDVNLVGKIKDFDLTAEIKIKNVTYLEGEIRDLNLYATVSNQGEILILPMIFTVPGDGLFRVNGALDNSTGLPKFVGKFDASGKDFKEVFKWLKIESQNLKFDNLKGYSLYSDMLLLPNSITLNNFYLNLADGQSEFLGELKIDNSGKSANITSRFQVSDFNIDSYFLTSGQNVYLSPGLLIKKLLWLNDISANNDSFFSFDKLIYKGEEFPAQSVKLKFGRGYLEINDLNLQSAKTNLKASLTVDISDKHPLFEMNISADNFHYDAMHKTTAPTIQNHNFFDQFFAMPSLEGFDGNISINLSNFENDDLKIKNLKFGGKLKDGNIEASELACDLYGGSLSYKGLVGLKQNKTINGNLSFNNADIQPLLSDLIGVKNVSGIANISASITAAASKKEEFSKQLSSEIKFNANSPSVEGYGLNDLVKKMFALQNFRQELQDPEKILLNPQSKTIFKQASGAVQINNGKEGRLRVNVTAPAVNGILSGTVNAENKTIDASFNAIFLTGNRQKQTPINIATNLKGKLDAISQSTNLDQVRQYLGLTKQPEKIIEATPSEQKELVIEKSQMLPIQETKPIPAQ
jgi:uncharacterized protein involved in outer membrane biogenesis